MQQLGIFNDQQQPQPDHLRPLETVLINPECQRVGAKRRIPPGRYTENREPVRKSARTIYSDVHGNLAIAREIEREWSPIVNARPAIESYLANTYFDTGIRWERFAEGIRVVPEPGSSFTDNNRWREGLYKGVENPQNNQIITWTKLGTPSHERTVYQMNLNNQVAMGPLLQPQGMTTENFLRDISYYPVKSYRLLQDNVLTYQVLNETLSRMEELRELRLKFNFNANNSFNNFINHPMQWLRVIASPL